MLCQLTDLSVACTPKEQCVTVILVREDNLVGLLGELAMAAAAATNRRALALAVGAVFGREMGLVGLKLVLPPIEEGDSWSAVRWRSGHVSVEECRPLAPPLAGERPTAKTMGDQWSLSVALPLQSQRSGTMTVVCRRGEPHMARDDEAIVAAARIVGMACHSCDLLAKVAGLSRRAYKENRRLRHRLHELGSEDTVVAVSAAMRSIVAQCELAAPHTVSVLLRGESGTGKEILARYIHERSDRATAPFVALNCAALPESLIESELFGHEKGAFTGALDRHIGRFERASGGTLFLDEVAELPVSMQAKLLRALQERAIERVGGRQPIPVDVRIIAATHRPIERMLEEGTFRTDLYFRLNVLPIEIPPLRDHPDDIPELVRRKLGQICERMARPVPHVSQSLMRALCSASWPGNVRELENHLERALILSPGDKLVMPAPALAPVRSEGRRGSMQPAQTLNDAVRAAIEAALKTTKGKIYGADGAAALLGLKPSTLQAKMSKLRIDRANFT